MFKDKDKVKEKYSKNNNCFLFYVMRRLIVIEVSEIRLCCYFEYDKYVML